MKLFAAASLLIALLGGACDSGERALAYRYRLTVEIDTPSGLRTGSGVIEVEPQLRGERAAYMALDGQAVPVDLRGGRALYVLLRSKVSLDWAGWIILWLVRTPQVNNLSMADQIRVAGSSRDLMVLPARLPSGAGYGLAGEDARPTFVTFQNPRDPSTVRIVDADDLAGTFGAGTRFRRITLQVTSDPVSTGLRTRLPWLGEMDGSLIRAENSSPEWLRQLETITVTAFERKGQ